MHSSVDTEATNVWFWTSAEPLLPVKMDGLPIRAFIGLSSNERQRF